MKNKKQLTVDPSRFGASSLQSRVRNGFSTLLIILVVAIVGVTVLVALGVLNVGNIKKSTPTSVSQRTDDQQVRDLSVLGSSDKVSDIEKDLNNTKLEGLDQEIPQIDNDTSSL